MRGLLLVPVLLLAMVGCSTSGTPVADDTVMPADFGGTVTYRTGSVAPPYHYQWTLQLREGTATISWWPGYDTAGEPWRHQVEVSQDQRGTFYRALRAAGVFQAGDPIGDHLVGGPTGELRLTASGQDYRLSSLGADRAGQQLLDRVHDAVTALLPADVWQDLQQRQQDYAENHR